MISPSSFVPSEVEGRVSASVPAPLDYARDERVWGYTKVRAHG
jgi:hypothetical protein